MKTLFLLAFFALTVATNALDQVAAASAAKPRSRLPVKHDAQIHQSLPIRAGPPRPVSTMHGGCEFLAFSNRAFKTVDLQVSSSMRTPADCISWLRNNMKVYQAVEYNAKTSNCRAVKLAKWNNTLSSLDSTLFAQKPNVLGNPSALLWYHPFDAKYDRVSERRLLQILKKIKKYARRLPTQVRLHVERVLISAYRSKLALKEAAKRYHKKYQVADKKINAKFEIWWLTLEKHFRSAVKFIDGKIKIKGLKLNHESHKKHNLKKHKKQFVKKITHSLAIPAEKMPFVTSIVNMVSSSKVSIEDAAKKVHGDALKAGKVKQDFSIWLRSVKLYVEQTLRDKSLQNSKVKLMNFKVNGVKIVVNTSKSNGKN